MTAADATQADPARPATRFGPEPPVRIERPAQHHRWRRLTFLHWPVPATAIAPTLPTGLTVDTFDDTAWIGLVLFHLDIRVPGIPYVPWAGRFVETNVRTYVRVGDRPGVYFFSLDAGSALAVRAARLLFNLPYYLASMDVKAGTAGVSYESTRSTSGRPAEFSASYRPVGPPGPASERSLEYFLTERYCLYTTDRRGRVWRCDIHHAQWPLQPAAAEVEVNTMLRQIGLMLPDTPPLLHFARRLDVVAWRPSRV